ncbi:hypothetical protein SNE40_016596 [Patella caerulea]|uniref:Dynein light chain n=1 Tax=Patella caerulea TaxID=87958 RepID=A0AAN8JEL6_PATCE
MFSSHNTGTKNTPRNGFRGSFLKSTHGYINTADRSRQITDSYGDTSGTLKLPKVGKRTCNNQVSDVIKPRSNLPIAGNVVSDVSWQREKELERITEKVLNENLHSTKYSPVSCKEKSQLLAAIIMDRVKCVVDSSFKVVAAVSIGSLTEKPAMQFGSRCLWNKETDHFISVKYSNSHIFAVAMIYCLYFE